MEIDDSGLRFGNIKNNAFWSGVHMDTTLYPSKGVDADYKAFLKESINNPTVGLLAEKRYISGKLNYPDAYHRNREIIEYNPQIAKLKNTLDKKIKELYPKTKEIREYIASSNRVVLNCVEKSKIYNILNKLKIKNLIKNSK